MSYIVHTVTAGTVPASHQTAASALVDLLYAQDDPFGLLLSFRPLLVGPAWDAVCGLMEVCEVHTCDSAICRDDEATCPAGRGD